MAFECISEHSEAYQSFRRHIMAFRCISEHSEAYQDIQRHIRALLLLLKKVGSSRLRESGIHPISPKTPAPQYQPIDRKKRKGKKVEDYSRDRAA